MRAFTSIEQSKKLAKILPIESADMWWNFYSVTTDNTTPLIIHLDEPWIGNFNWNNESDNIPAWSLAALLDVLPKNIGRYTKSLYWFDEDWHCEYEDEDAEGLYGASADEPIDSCVEMIIKLKEKGIL